MWLICVFACTDGDPPDTPDFSPAGRTAAVGFVDADATSLWLAGGRTASGTTDETAQLSLESGAWIGTPPAGEPLARAAASAGGPGAVVFGGSSAFEQETDHTWIWVSEDPVPWQPGSSAPPARAWHAAAWDSGQLWVHGGRQDDGDVLVFADLWSYDPAADLWTEHEVPAGGLGERYRHSITWLDGLLWLYGGVDDLGNRTDELWSLDLGTGTWQLQDPGPTAPSGRSSHRLQTVDGRLWLWGGDLSDGAVWTRGAADVTWTALEDDLAPAPREDTLAAPLPDGSGLLIFGGELSDGTLADDVWSWDGDAWTEVVPLGGP